jgi:hypothetical protein
MLGVPPQKLHFVEHEEVLLVPHTNPFVWQSGLDDELVGPLCVVGLVLSDQKDLAGGLGWV